MLYLPGTNNTCWIKDEVFYANGSSVDIHDGCYLFDWYAGYRQYEAKLVHFACKVSFPFDISYYDKITVVSKNGDLTDFSEDNLLYRFTEPVEHDILPGFYLIPEFSNLVISRKGELFDLIKWFPVKWGVIKPNKTINTTGGYRQVTRVNDRGVRANLKRHRAMLIVFKGMPDGVGNLVPDHLNNVPGDDWPENLEWVTRKENNQRAYDNYLRPNAARAILVKNLKTNEILKFPTVKMAATHCGYPTGTFIYYRMRDWPNSVYSDYLQFKYDDGTQWPELDWSVIRKANNRMAVAAYDVVNEKIIVAASAAELSNLIGIDADTITRYARKRLEKFVGGFWIRYPDEMSGIPVVSKERLEILRSNGWKTGVMIEVSDVDKSVSGVVIDVSEALGISKTVLFNAVREKKNYVGKYKIRVIE